MNFIRLFFIISFLSLVISNDFMFAFGTDYDDLTLPNLKNSVAQLFLPVTFKFFGQTIKQIIIDSSGVIWLNSYCPSCSKPKAFPAQAGQPLVACFWADNDPSVNPTTRVYFRISHDQQSWINATNLLNKAFGTSVKINSYSNSSVLIIATWLNISYNGGSNATATNSYQCAVISDGTNGYVLFDHVQLKWPNSPSQSNNPAIVGIDTGNTDHTYNNFTLPYSHTSLVTTLQSYTNFVQRTSDNSPFGWSSIAQQNPPVPRGYPFNQNAAPNRCWANGDPHYFTFDNHNGLDNFFHGSATWKQPFGTYILAASANCHPSDYPQFKIDILVDRFEGNDVDPPLSTAAGMIINFYFDTTMTITLHNNGYTIGNNPVYGYYQCPIYLCSTYTFSVDVYNLGYRVQTNFGLTAIYYKVYGNGGYVEVDLPNVTSLFDNVFGYCGNMNGNPNDDNLCYNSALSGENDYQYCWTDSTARQLSNGYFECPYSHFYTTDVHMTSEPEIASLDSIAAQKCNILNDTNGPFSQCQDDPNLYSIFASCQIDLDACNGLQDVFCGYAAMLAQSCLGLPNVTSLDWRNESFCPPQCQYNAHYSSSTSRCISTCNDPLAAQFCNAPPTENCVCDDGLVMEGGMCIWLSQCGGCLDDTGNYWSAGSRWLTSDCTQNCICSNSGDTSCSSTRCDAHAKCTTSGSSATCQCEAGFFGNGFFCSPTDRCIPNNDCSNNSTCITNQNSYTCLCVNGYTGQHCENEIDLCNPDPCVNGTCVSSLSSYKCNCSFGFDGDHCDRKKSWCSSFPCTNLATCIDIENDYKCVCLQGYTGPNCECLFPSLDCSNLHDGDYADPCLVCANTYYSCSGGYLYVRNCAESTLYFDDITDKCLPKADVSACNPMGNKTMFHT